MNWDSVSHYEILQVAPTAPLSVIKASYKALIQQYHPDRYQPADEAERISRRLNEAYVALSDPDLRAAHDSFLSERSTRREPPPAAPPRAPSPKPSTPPEADSLEMGWWGRIAMLFMLLFSGYIGAGLLGGGVIPYLIGAGAGGVLFGFGRKWWIAWNVVGKAALLVAWLAICLCGVVFKQMRINEVRTPQLAAVSPTNATAGEQLGNGSSLPPGFVLDESSSSQQLPPGFEWEEPSESVSQNGQPPRQADSPASAALPPHCVDYTSVSFPANFNGGRVTYNLQSIPLSSFLKLIAEESNRSIIPSDDVSRAITACALNVPWDYALEKVLTDNGYGQTDYNGSIRVFKR